MQIQVEESALDSIKRMAQQLQDERDEFLAALIDVRKQALHPFYEWTIDLQEKVDAEIAKAESSA